MSGFDREPMRGELTVPAPADDPLVEIAARAMAADYPGGYDGLPEDASQPKLAVPNTFGMSKEVLLGMAIDAIAALHAAGCVVVAREPSDAMVERARLGMMGEDFLPISILSKTEQEELALAALRAALARTGEPNGDVAGAKLGPEETLTVTVQGCEVTTTTHRPPSIQDARMPRAALFQPGTFVAHSGQTLHWKVECDALTPQDWLALARIASERLPPFGSVEGVPRGGLAFADALRRYATEGPLLIADDVLTTGESMEAHRAGREAIGVVAFSRTPEPPPWVHAIWTLRAALEAPDA